MTGPVHAGVMDARSRPNREVLIELVRERPGMNATTLARDTGLDDTTVSYHLRKLAREGRVTSEVYGRELVWFTQAPGCSFCPVLRRAIPLLGREGPAALAGSLGPDPRSIQGLARAAGVTAASARRSSAALTDLGMTLRTAYGRVYLRPGAQTCVAKALARETCGEWGTCSVSKAWQARRQLNTVEQRKTI